MLVLAFWLLEPSHCKRQTSLYFLFNCRTEDSVKNKNGDVYLLHREGSSHHFSAIFPLEFKLDNKIVDTYGFYVS